MLNEYILLFCRIAIGLAFAISAFGKARSIPSFQAAIANFSLLPTRLNKIAAYLAIAGEVFTVILLTIGGNFLLPAFALAALLLIVFSGALATALYRKMQFDCNCFGPTQSKISATDLWRNAGFLLCIIIGVILKLLINTNYQPTIPEYVMITVCAVLFVEFWTNLSNLVGLFR